MSAILQLIISWIAYDFGLKLKRGSLDFSFLFQNRLFIVSDFQIIIELICCMEL